MKPEILIVEDELNLGEAIQLNLDLEGYSTTLISNGNTAYNLLIESSRKFDLVILDVMLPEKDGLSLIKNFRQVNNDTPVMFLSSKNSSHDKIIGLKLGADDYLGKPFNLEELLVRVKILLNRNLKSKPTESPSQKSLTNIQIGTGDVNFVSHTIRTWNGEVVSPTKKEMELLRFFAEQPNQVISRDDILEKLWSSESVSSRTIDNLILNFRKYFEENPKQPQFFYSIRGVGYKFSNN